MKYLFITLLFFNFAFAEYSQIVTAQNLNLSLQEYNFFMALIGSVFGLIFFFITVYITVLVCSK